MNVAADTPLAAQTTGDCRTAVCNGNGGVGSINNAGDIANDNTVCTTDTCNAGTPEHTPVMTGATCAEGAGVVCSAAGTCVECNVNADCAGGSCVNNVCEQTCFDAVLNNGETDVDCGGPNCPDCANGFMCEANSDCTSGFCLPDMMMSMCATPTCMDGFQNGSETGLDCGGSLCPACPVGQGCSADTDCTSGMCYGNVCVASVNGCDVATATDYTVTPPPPITFANGNFSYAPRCIKVTLDTVVTFNGNFAGHPNQGGQVIGGAAVPATSGPFVPVTNTGTTKNFTMSTPGTFPYYCVPHAVSQNMTGAIFVVSP